MKTGGTMWRHVTRLAMAVPMLLAACDFRTVTRNAESEGAEIDIYRHEVKDLRGDHVSLSQFRGQVVLLVNLASQCGYTGPVSYTHLTLPTHPYV